MLDTQANIFFDFEKAYNKFMETFSENEKDKADKIADYIFRQLNAETLKGDLNYVSYVEAIERAISNLFKLIYLEQYECNRPEELIHPDIVYASAHNFTMLLFTRVFMGADRGLIVKWLESLRPPAVVQR